MSRTEQYYHGNEIDARNELPLSLSIGNNPAKNIYKMGRAMMLGSPLKGLLCQFFLCVQCSMDDQTYHVYEKHKR